MKIRHLLAMVGKPAIIPTGTHAKRTVTITAVRVDDGLVECKDQHGNVWVGEAELIEIKG